MRYRKIRNPEMREEFVYRAHNPRTGETLEGADFANVVKYLTTEFNEIVTADEPECWCADPRRSLCPRHYRDVEHLLGEWQLQLVLRRREASDEA